jgi:heterodisulfide reductase subunit C
MEYTACKECGACSAVCPIVELYPARVVHEVYSRPGFDPWLCCSCHLCAEVCPVGLSSRDAMFSLRRIGSAGGAAAQKVAVHMRNLKKRGFLFPVGEISNEERSDAGLLPIAYDKISLDMQSFVIRFEQVMETFAVGWGGK